jgi:hypothetical protein
MAKTYFDPVWAASGLLPDSVSFGTGKAAGEDPEFSGTPEGVAAALLREGPR